MADKVARSHTQKSNREQQRNQGERKVVFKGVLDNPFRIQWPSIPINLQNSILSHMLLLLEGVSSYHHAQCRKSRKRKRSNESAGNPVKKLEDGKPERVDDRLETGQSLLPALNCTPYPTTRIHTATGSETTTQYRPPILHHIVYGINSVTKRLEDQTRRARRSVILSTIESPVPSTQPPLSFIFVCRADIDPPLLIEHLPHLVAAFNSVQTNDFVKLVPLPRESELRLAQSLGIRRAAIIGLDSQYPGIIDLAAKLRSVPVLTAPWLAVQVETPPKFVSTHIKQLRTSAPKDLKSAKEIRSREKRGAKERRIARKSAIT